LYHAHALDELDAKYEDCPNTCAEGFHPLACEGCPVKAANEFFQENFKEQLELKLGDDAKKFSLNKLIGTVIDVSEAESLNPGNCSVTTYRLVRTLKTERNLFEKYQRENAKNDKQ